MAIAQTRMTATAKGLVAMFWLLPVAASAGDAANEIAEKFSGSKPASNTRPVRPSSKGEDARIRSADEAEMLARARAEAADRVAAQRLEVQRREAADQDAAETRAVRADAATRQEELQRLSDKLRRVRAARDARLAEAAVQASSTARSSGTASAPPPASATSAPPPAVVAAIANRPSLSSTLPATPSRSASAEPSTPDGTPRSGLGMPPSIPTPDRVAHSEIHPLLPQTARAGARAAIEPVAARYTVLLVMARGHRGIRRFDPTTDPVLCNGQGCYVSNGPDVPARFMRGRKALGFLNTWGGRAGACMHSLGCVFRGVEIDTAAGAGTLQPVDLHLLRHDRREPQMITGSSGCHAIPGHLACEKGIRTSEYQMWIVPETLAELAGEQGLEMALADGLGSGRSAEVYEPAGRRERH